MRVARWPTSYTYTYINHRRFVQLVSMAVEWATIKTPKIKPVLSLRIIFFLSFFLGSSSILIFFSFGFDNIFVWFFIGSVHIFINRIIIIESNQMKQTQGMVCYKTIIIIQISKNTSKQINNVNLIITTTTKIMINLISWLRFSLNVFFQNLES